MAGVTASTRLLALLGDPVAHSLSPAIQNAGIASLGLDGVYVALRCGAAEIAGLMRGIARAGGGGNVTLPHKETAARNLDVASPAVRRTGACNTFWWDDERMHGDNTDVQGVRGAVEALCGPVRDGRVLLLGAGGVARATAAALLAEGVGEVLVLNRTVERARALAGRMGDPRVRVLPDTAAAVGGHFDLVVNATRLGLRSGDALPVDLGGLGVARAVLDLVYTPSGDTGLVGAARARGIPAADGGEMLLRQGAASFARWWGVPAPLEAMRTALDGARTGAE
jgi:shikimate dehydrogenase